MIERLCDCMLAALVLLGAGLEGITLETRRESSCL